MISYDNYSTIQEIKNYVRGTASYERVLSMITGLYLLWFGDGLMQIILSQTKITINIDLLMPILYLFFVAESLTFNCHEYYNKVMILIPESSIGIITSFLCTLFFTLFLVLEILYPTYCVVAVAMAVLMICIKNIQIWFELSKENPIRKYFAKWIRNSFGYALGLGVVGYLIIPPALEGNIGIKKFGINIAAALIITVFSLKNLFQIPIKKIEEELGEYLKKK